MYQLVTARYKSDRRAGRWVEADLSNALITTLATTYGDVWLYITYPSLVEPKAVRLSDFQNMLNGVTSTTTVQEWLAQIGNLTLPFAKQLPDFNPRYVEYCQAWHSGYDIHPVGRPGVMEDNLSTRAREDLMITHPNFTPKFINEHCLFTVNGYFHLTDFAENGVRVIDGNTTVMKSNDNQIGLYSFQDIGAIQTLPLKDANLHAMNETAPLWDGVYTNIPESIDLTNKTVLLVLGGYLQVLGKTYRRVGDRAWKIEMGNSMFLDRFIQSLKDMDLSSLNVEAPEENPSFALVSQLKSDETVRAYLELSQSFFVIVDSPSFFQEYIPLEYIGLEGRYIGSEKLQYPVVGAYGRMLDYHIIEEDGRFVYCCVPNVRHDYDAGHRKWQQMRAVDGGRYPHKPSVPAQAYLRRLGVEG